MTGRGFTLVELLVTLTIVGILAALAIPNYSLFKQNAFNSMASSDARNFISAAELVAGQGGLPEPITLSGVGGPIAELPGAVASVGTLGIVDVTPNRYVVETHHLNGSLCYRYDSNSSGGLAVIDIASCTGGG